MLQCHMIPCLLEKSNCHRNCCGSGSPLKFFLRPANCRATAIALLPFRYPKRITWLIHFFLTVYLIRLHTENFDKYSYFRKKRHLFGLDIGKINICGDKMVTRCHLEIRVFFQLLKFQHNQFSGINLRRNRSINELIPWLYLKGVSTGIRTIIPHQ